MAYGRLPCRQCGLPVIGTYSENDISFCCSRKNCIKKDDKKKLTNKDKPLKSISKEKWLRQIHLDTRGY